MVGTAARPPAADRILPGAEPHPLAATLTPTERAGRRSQPSGATGASEPDPTGQAPRDGDWTQVETAVAFATGTDKNTACVHLAFQLTPGEDVHWNNETEPMRVWLAAPDSGEGKLDAQLLEHAPPATATSDERRCFTVELALDPECAKTTLRGYALFHACGEDGTCRFLRRDFEIPVER